MAAEACGSWPCADNPAIGEICSPRVRLRFWRRGERVELPQRRAVVVTQGHSGGQAEALGRRARGPRPWRQRLRGHGGLQWGPGPVLSFGGG